LFATPPTPPTGPWSIFDPTIFGTRVPSMDAWYRALAEPPDVTPPTPPTGPWSIFDPSIFATRLSFPDSWPPVVQPIFARPPRPATGPFYVGELIAADAVPSMDGWFREFMLPPDTLKPFDYGTGPFYQPDPQHFRQEAGLSWFRPLEEPPAGVPPLRPLPPPLSPFQGPEFTFRADKLRAIYLIRPPGAALSFTTSPPGTDDIYTVSPPAADETYTVAPPPSGDTYTVAPPPAVDDFTITEEDC
jgi:hypothetical protein